MKKIFFLSLIFCALSLGTAAQQLSQTIRGRVVERNTQEPIPGVNVQVAVGGELRGAATNEQGEFSLEKIPVGRYSLSATMLGYAPFVASNVLVNSGKEVVLEIFLEESVSELDAVVVTAKVDKDLPLNKMASVSARMLSSEEANRYAGSWGDPARMAANFAGVMASDDSRNDIIIRGNSPSGVLWRLDGFDIPNPNHFGAMGGTGGPVGMINNNQLTNSDFYTSAFPAEYGNATSGVFDLRLRNGNSEQHEFMGSMGFNGFELGAEGPISKKTGATYMVNARYSFLKLLDLVGVNIAGTGGAVPEYQDLTAKINIPLKSGNLSLITMLGASRIHIKPDMTDTAEWFAGEAGQEVLMKNRQYFVGLSYTHRFSPDTRLENRLAYRHFGVSTDVHVVEFPTEKRVKYFDGKDKESSLSYSPTLLHKVNSRNFLQVGAGVDIFNTDMRNVAFEPDQSTTVEHDGAHRTALAKGYAQWQHRFSNALSVTPGLYSQYYLLSGEATVEPRVGLKYTVSARSSLNFGAGLHSQVAPRQVSFYIENGAYPNKKLKMNKSFQAVLGYDLKLAKSTRLKAEVYYQHLYDVPVIPEIPEESLLNFGDGFYNDNSYVFANGGTGKNYGVEFTLEKFFSSGYYYLLTASLYDSKYKGYDGVERHTRFAGNYTLTTLAGYEWKVFKADLISLNLKASYLGGKRFVNSSSANTINDFEAVLDYSQAYQKRMPNYFRCDINLNMKSNYKRMALEYFFEVNNVTNHKNIMFRTFNSSTGKYDITYQQGFMPMGGCRVYF
ncbi:MAG: TonB-dependent receptor [Prevotellaceae bacterium]|jgi:hypothetical protein|nr:TonB-dependent receptor [Prevotellaceae bacterium]